MVQGRMGSLILKRMNMVLVIGCVFVLLSGCSSQLRTTMGSSSEATKGDVDQLKPEQLVAEEIVAQPNSKNSVMDIPVEEPARPVMQREFASDIHATPKTADVSSEIGAPLESAPASSPPGEQIVSSMSEPTRQQPMAGIPPIYIEPEMPALPKPAYDEVTSSSQEFPQDSSVEDLQAEITLIPEPLAEPKPMQIAKVMPQELKQAAITTEALEAALSDIYFDYDQFAIREDAGALLKANAQLLLSNFAERRIVIEGHCDERGTQSYNMVLGERRAKAVKSFLEDLGVPAENLQAVSYGKDKPFCTESTQDCWQGNRRGHFLIQ